MQTDAQKADEQIAWTNAHWDKHLSEKAQDAIALAAAKWDNYEALHAHAQQARTCANAEAANAAYASYLKAFDRAVSAVACAPQGFDASDFVCTGRRAHLSL